MTRDGIAGDRAGALKVRGLEAGYGKIQVLWEIDLDVAPGELVTIIGANGAGKTTLLRALTGLIPIRGGTARALGVPLKRRSAAAVVRGGVGHARRWRDSPG